MGSMAQTGLLLVPSDALAPRPHLGLTPGVLGVGPGTNFVEFISKSAGAERLRKF